MDNGSQETDYYTEKWINVSAVLLQTGTTTIYFSTVNKGLYILIDMYNFFLLSSQKLNASHFIQKFITDIAFGIGSN